MIAVAWVRRVLIALAVVVVALGFVSTPTTAHVLHQAARSAGLYGYDGTAQNAPTRSVIEPWLVHADERVPCSSPTGFRLSS